MTEAQKRFERVQAYVSAFRHRLPDSNECKPLSKVCQELDLPPATVTVALRRMKAFSALAGISLATRRVKPPRGSARRGYRGTMKVREVRTWET